LLLKRLLNVHTGILLLTCVAAPLLLSLTTGQKSSFLFLILTGTWALWRANKPFASGAIFGLIAFKPHLGIPVGLFMLFRKQWSFVLGCYFSVGLLMVASLMTGFDICTDYFCVTMGFSDYVQSGGYHLEQGFSLWSAWQLAVHDATIAKIATIVSSLAILAGTVYFLRRPSCHQGDNLSRSFSAMTIATVLVSPHLYAYDLAMLLLPAILLSDIAIRRQDNWQNFAPVIALAILLFGMNPLITFGAASGLNLGVPLMVVAWVFTLKSVQEETRAMEPAKATLSPAN